MTRFQWIRGVLTYRGAEGQWSQAAHRLTGVGVLVFLVLHIVDTFLVMYGPDVYGEALALYRTPVVRIGEVILAGAVIFHALNGLRIMVVDFWEKSSKYQRAMFYAVVVVFLILFIPATYFMMAPLF